MKPYGWLWIGGNYPGDGTASAEPSHGTFTPFDVDHCRVISMHCSLSRTVNAFLSPVQLWRSDVLFFNASAFHSDCCSRVINSSWILRCDADRRGANANWHRSGDLWPRHGCPTETGLPLILRMKRGDNALYIFPFLELLIIVRSALWPKNRFLMRCCFPITSPST